jgi:hypothetical protein
MQASQFLDQREANASAFVRAAVLALDSVKSLEQPGQFFLGNSHSRVLHAQLHAPVAGRFAQRNRNLTFEGVLESVRDQIENDLLPHVAVDKGRRRHRLAIDHIAQAGLVHRGLKRAGELRGVGGEVNRLVERLNSARLEPREIEQRVDQLQEPQTIAAHQLNLLPIDRDHAGGSALQQDILERTQHQSERRAELVTGIGKKRGLGAIDLSQRNCTALLALIGAHVRQSSGNLPGQQIDKPSVRIIQRSIRIETDDYHPGRLFPRLLSDRNDDRLSRRDIPVSGRQITKTGRGIINPHGRRFRQRLLNRPLACL